MTALACPECTDMCVRAEVVFGRELVPWQRHLLTRLMKCPAHAAEAEVLVPWAQGRSR